MEFPSLNSLTYPAALIFVVGVHTLRTSSKLPMQFEVVLSSRGGGREGRRMWKIGGEGAARYPGIGMSSLARNFAPIVVSYLFAWVSCSRLRLPFPVPFSLSFLSLPPGRWHVFSSPFLAFSLDDIIRLLMQDTLSLSLKRVLLILIQRINSLEWHYVMGISSAILRRDEWSGSAFIHWRMYVRPTKQSRRGRLR